MNMAPHGHPALVPLVYKYHFINPQTVFPTVLHPILGRNGADFSVAPTAPRGLLIPCVIDRFHLCPDAYQQLCARYDCCRKVARCRSEGCSVSPSDASSPPFCGFSVFLHVTTAFSLRWLVFSPGSPCPIVHMCFHVNLPVQTVMFSSLCQCPVFRSIWAGHSTLQLHILTPKYVGMTVTQSSYWQLKWWLQWCNSNS